MIPNIGLQLYSLRQQLAENFSETLERVALFGYEGVELAGLHNYKPTHVAQLLTTLNLKPISMHCDVLSADGLKRSLDDAEALNCPNLVCPWCPPHTFDTEKSIGQLAEKLNFANEEILTRGKRLHYHNHDFEFRKLNGNYAFNLLEKHLSPTICFELDTYLATVGDANSIDILNTFYDRIKMLHLKDGAISPPNPNTAIGDGAMNFHGIFEAIPPNVEWLFVELEDCEADMFEAVRRSVGNIEAICGSIFY